MEKVIELSLSHPRACVIKVESEAMDDSVYQEAKAMECSNKKQSIETVFLLFKKYGDDDYLGEPVNQLQHATQCAMLAEKEGFPTEVVLGAFLHDIGHLVGKDKGLNQMITDGEVIGIQHHDKVGEDYLRDIGFPKAVTDFVGGHVSAKRYLVYKKAGYYEQLSSASKMTLVHQGGPMTAEEADTFENSDSFQAILRMRTWDEQAKDPDVTTDPLEKYENMCLEYLNDLNTL